MGSPILQPARSAAWKLASRQHGVITRRQLLDLGFSRQAIAHRIASGRLHPVFSGVYAVGRPQLTKLGRWMAAVLSCGPEAVLSHGSAAALWEICRFVEGPIEVSVPAGVNRAKRGVVVHRRTNLRPDDVSRHQDIPVTSPICTLVDIATREADDRVEAAINEADKRDLAHPDEIRHALDGMPRRSGRRALRQLLDRRTFRLTDSELERRFLPLARAAGLPVPETRRNVNGFRVDFYWPTLRLVVETDGLRYHRTPAQQARDRIRDQAHAVAGLTPLRFTHAQVRFEPGHIVATLRAVAARLQAEGATA